MSISVLSGNAFYRGSARRPRWRPPLPSLVLAAFLWLMLGLVAWQLVR